MIDVLAIEHRNVKHDFRIGCWFGLALCLFGTSLQAAEADLVLAILDLDRMHQLHEQQFLPTQKWDEAHAQKLVTSAALAQAQESQMLWRASQPAQCRAEHTWWSVVLTGIPFRACTGFQ